MAILRILAATDGSIGALRAVAVAAELAKAAEAELLIVTFGDYVSGAEMDKLVRAEGDVGAALELIAKRTLLDAKEGATRVGASNVRMWSGSGDPAEGIIEAARRERSDIVVVGRRGRGQLAGLLLGSVSQKLVSLAPCAVLVVP